jgi:hypothetical protein
MIEILDGINGHGLKLKGRQVHCPDHPFEEARAMIRSLPSCRTGLILVFGVGLGYHLAALGERYPASRLVAFDPSAEIINAFNRFGPPDVRRRDVIHDWDALNDLLHKEVVHGDHPDPVTLVLPAYRTLFPRQASTFEDIIRAARVRRAVIDKTNREKGDLFLSHLADNLAVVMKTPLLTDLFGRFSHKPGFIIGSGPSIAQDMDRLAELGRYGLVLAAGSAVRPMTAAGATPHVAVVVEAEDTSDYLAGLPVAPDTILAVASAAHPNHFAVEGYTRTVYHLSPGAAYLYGTDYFVPQAGTAGSAAFTLGLLLGLDPLILIGQDQAFSAGRMHAPGTPGDIPLNPDLASFRVPGLKGDRLPTHSAFAASLHWYAESIRHMKVKWAGRRVVNAAADGARIPGTAVIPLERVLSRLKKIDDPKHHLGDMLKDLTLPDPATVRKRVTDTLDLIGWLVHAARNDSQKFGLVIEEARCTHPFIKLALAGKRHEALPAEARAGLEIAEMKLLNMLQGLGDHD